MHPEPAALDRELEAGAVFGRAALMFRQKRPVDLSIWMRPSCTGSTELAISISFRAATSGSAKERAATSFI